MDPSQKYNHQDVHIFAGFTKHFEIHLGLDIGQGHLSSDIEIFGNGKLRMCSNISVQVLDILRLL